MGATTISIGPKSELPSFFERLLSYSSDTPTLLQFASIFTTFVDARRVSKKLVGLGSAQVTFHFYEGGFREFLIANWCLRRTPNSFLLFNFSLVDPWLEVFQSGSRVTRKVLTSLASLARSLEERSVFYSESQAMSDLLHRHLGIRTLPYPLFTTVMDVDSHELKRTTDVTFFPMNDLELDFCLDVIRRVETRLGNSLKTKIVPKWGYTVSRPVLQELTYAGVQVVQEQLSDLDYAKLYARTKVSFLPYFSDYYVYSSSGRALDASSLGSVVFAPLGTATGDLVKQRKIGQVFQKDDSEEAALLLISSLASPKAPRLGSNLRARVSLEAFASDLSRCTNRSSPASEKPRLSDLLWGSLAIFSTSRVHKASIVAQALQVPDALKRLTKKFMTGNR